MKLQYEFNEVEVMNYTISFSYKKFSSRIQKTHTYLRLFNAYSTLRDLLTTREL